MKKYLAVINSEFISPSIAVTRGISWSNPMETLLKIYHHYMSESPHKNSIHFILSAPGRYWGWTKLLITGNI
ncbi:MAG TPA: hypothetical protein VND99_05595 [Candidatus Acidoferrales bacterium]|nr:hypothetical protein [Candidatus Acidoferrales bacterium]